MRRATPREHPRLSETGLALLGFYVVIVILSMIQDVGLTTYDTRAELTERPADFLAGVFTLWHGGANFGELQNQAYGYLFPQGPWFALGDLLGSPAWVTQRLWSALLLIVACEGARRVAAASGVAPWGTVLAGIAYALTPRILGTDGVITGETLASAMVPWALLPVLLHLRRGLGGRQAALLSGAAVVTMGGVNAVEVIAALPLVAIVVVWGVARGLTRRRFLFQWGGAVALASLWWMLPLLVLGRYAPPFYEYVESAANTTSLIGWSEAARGADHWVAFLTVGWQAWWPAAYYLATNSTMIIVAAAVSAFGLWGLVRLGNGLRTPYVLAVGLGLTVLTVAHGGWAGAPVAEWFRIAFDGSLQIFRNVHKIDPTVRLPIAIGFGQASVLAITWVTRRWTWARATAPLLGLIPAALVLTLLTPFVINQVRTPGWTEIPDHWTDAQAYLQEHDDGRATLLTPGTGFAMQYWGWTLDEPLLVLGGVPYAVRSQAPIIPGQSIRYLSSLDEIVSAGRARSDLADSLARAGIGHVVVRRDLDRSLTRSPAPAGASLSMLTAGLERVATFGTQEDGSSAIEVYAVDEQRPRLQITDREDVATVAGAPEAILDAQELVGASATVSAGEQDWDDPVDVVTDSNQRRERNFGEVTDGVSAVLAADDPWRVRRAAHDYPTAPDARQVVARYDGLASLSASSSRGYADTFGKVLPEFAPYAAIDGDPNSRWLSSPGSDPREQWIRLDFDTPRAVNRVRILPVQDPSAAALRSLEVAAGDQVRTVETGASGSTVTAEFDGSEVDFVEIRVDAVTTSARQEQMGLREVTIDDFEPRRSYVVPEPVGRESSWQFSSTPEQRACLPAFGLPQCNTRRIRVAEEATGMDRTFETPDGQTARVRGLALVRSTPDATELLDPIDSTQTIAASSVYGDDPKAAGRFAYDGLPETAWISSAEDVAPRLELDWDEPHRVRGISVDIGADYDRPVTVVLRYNGTFQRVRLLSSDMTAVKPFRTRNLTVSVLPQAAGLPVMLAELALDGVDIRREFDPATPTGAVCGFGPKVEIDGRAYDTRVTGTMGDVVEAIPLELEVCTPSAADVAESDDERAGEEREVTLGAGTHDLRTPPTTLFQVVRLDGISVDAGPDSAAPARSVTVDHWSSSERRAAVGPGDAALISVAENFNDGWRAELDGEELTPIRVDGWRQGFLVPEGDGGEVRLEFAPQRTYTVALVVGLVGSGLVLVAGLALALLLALTGGRAAGARGQQVGWPTEAGSAVLVAIAAPVLLVLAGPVAAVGVLAGALAARRDRVLLVASVAALLVAGSGLLDVLAGEQWHRQVADVAAALGVGGIVGCCLAAVRRPGLGTGPARQEASG